MRQQKDTMYINTHICVITQFVCVNECILHTIVFFFLKNKQKFSFIGDYYRHRSWGWGRGENAFVFYLLRFF